MNWLKNLLARFFALYLLIIFIIFVLIFFLPMWFVTTFLPPATRLRNFVRFGRLWSQLMLPVMGCPLRTRGKEHFAHNQTYIIVCNHTSFMDIPVTYAGIPGTHKSLAKKEMVKAPVFGVLYKIGSVLVDRKDPASRKQSFAEMKEVLENGMHMLLYPEGTRNKTGNPLKEFYDGAFSLAIETKKPILPAVIFNSKKILPHDKVFYALPHGLRMDFLPPVSSEGYLPEEVEKLKERVFKLMWEHLGTN